MTRSPLATAVSVPLTVVPDLVQAKVAWDLLETAQVIVYAAPVSRTASAAGILQSWDRLYYKSLQQQEQLLHLSTSI